MNKNLSKKKKNTTVIRDKPELKGSVLFAFNLYSKMEIYIN